MIELFFFTLEVRTGKLKNGVQVCSVICTVIAHRFSTTEHENSKHTVKLNGKYWIIFAF